MKTCNQTIVIVFSMIVSHFLFADESTSDSSTADGSGASLTKKYCAECHGEQGNGVGNIDSVDGIPKIAGFTAILLFDILDQFKHGEREAKKITNKNNQLTDMTTISKKLSEEEIQEISLYLSEQTFIPNKKITSSNKALITQGKQLHEDLCNDCHIDNGTGAADDAPILAGQNKSYLIRQFKQHSTGKRYTPRRMKRKFRKLSEDDKKALIEFYTST